MKKKVLSILCCATMVASMMGCSSTSSTTTATTAAAAETTAAAAEAAAPAQTSAEGTKIALITMDSIDQHWISLNEGAQQAAAELGVEVTFMSPNTKDDAQQIESVNNAVAGGYSAIIVAANGPDAISASLKEAMSAGVKIVYVDSPANVDAEATFSTDNKAAGTIAGEQMLAELKAAGITSGSIGVINVNAATDSCVMREEGFRAAFEGSGFEIMETQYGEGDAAKSQSIAENYITQGVVGIFGANEGSTTGAGNAIKAAGGTGIVGVGFDKSDAILNLITDGYLLCTMAQNPDIMGYEGVKAAVAAINGDSLGGAVTDTGVSVIDAAYLGGGSSSASTAAALKEAIDAGVKVVYVDSPANVDAEATFSTDNKAAGVTAGEEMLAALEAAGVTSGSIGIINVNAATDSCVMREEGFRAAFEGSGFEIMETQYGEGDAAKSQGIAENYITQGVVGIFGANEGSTTGAGNAIKASGSSSIVGVGFDQSDAILNLIADGYLLCTMAQNPDVMGSLGVEACVAALEGGSAGGAVTDTGVSVLK